MAGTLCIIALNHAVPDEIPAIVFVVAIALTELVVVSAFGAALLMLLFASSSASCAKHRSHAG
jgi:hypothetical protein